MLKQILDLFLIVLSSRNQFTFRRFRETYLLYIIMYKYILNKLAFIEPEFSDLSIILLTGTLLNESKPTKNFMFNEFQTPYGETV